MGTFGSEDFQGQLCLVCLCRCAAGDVSHRKGCECLLSISTVHLNSLFPSAATTVMKLHGIGWPRFYGVVEDERAEAWMVEEEQRIHVRVVAVRGHMGGGYTGVRPVLQA